jgi:hypothetical protein
MRPGAGNALATQANLLARRCGGLASQLGRNDNGNFRDTHPSRCGPGPAIGLVLGKAEAGDGTQTSLNILLVRDKEVVLAS